MLSSLSPARRRFVLTVVGAVVVIALVVAASLVVRRVAGGVTAVDQGVPGPVLLVTGYGGSTASVEPLRRELEALGRDVVVVEPVGAGTGDLDAQAERLEEVAAETMTTTGAPSVDVVGYSAGGVVARLWVAQHGGDSRARRVLTLGSPHHGTGTSQTAIDAIGSCPDACLQLAPDSDLLRSLNSGDETPAGPAYISIWTERDRVVTPPTSAELDGATNFSVQSVCPGDRSSHGQLPGSPVVEAALSSALGPDRVTTPEDIDCP